MYQWLDQKWMFKDFLQSIESIVMPSRYLKVMKTNSWYLCRAQTYVLSHSYMLFCRDSSPGVEFVAFYDHPRNMIFAYCCMLSIKTLNLFTGHLLQGSLAAPSLDLLAVSSGPRFVHHSALAERNHFLCSTTTRPSSLPHLQSVSKLWTHSLHLHCKSMTNVPRKKAIA